MIEEVDRSLERWLRAAVPLPQGAADVRFDQPDREWDARRSVPLVDLFLYALTPSAGRAATGSKVVPREGGLARQHTVPVVEARYLISVWGGGPGVEHDLLGRIMSLLAASKAIPSEHLSESLRRTQPAHTLSLSPDEGTTPTQLWTGLSIPPRPSVQLRIETPLALPVAVPAADPPRSLELGTTDPRVPAARSRRRRQFGRADAAVAGGRVIGRRGSALIEDSGRYNVEADPGDELEVQDEQGNQVGEPTRAGEDG